MSPATHGRISSPATPAAEDDGEAMSAPIYGFSPVGLDY
jgi:hypothetical protein